MNFNADEVHEKDNKALNRFLVNHKKSRPHAAKPWRSVRLYFLASGILILVLFVTALFTSWTVSKSTDEVIRNHAVDLIQLRELEYLIERTVSKNRAYLLTGDESLVDGGAEAQDMYQNALKNLKRRFVDREGESLLEAVEDAEKIYDESASRLMDLRESGANQSDVSEFFQRVLTPKRDKVKAAIRAAILYEDRQFRISRESAQRTTQRGFVLLMTTGVLGLLFSALLFYFLSRTIRQKEKVDGDLALKKLKLQKSNEELEQFASVAAHDLRSPLQSMISWSHMLEELVPRPRDKMVDQAISYIGQSAKKATVLIDDLLAMSRVNKEIAELVPVDLNKTVQEILAVLKEEIDRLGAHIEVNELPQVVGNPTHLESLFSNLIRNALTYRDKLRRPVIVIGYTKRKTFYEFFVGDNGIGIAPEHLETIFQMFKRLHGYSDYPGTGIGLAFCRKVAEIYGGRIWVASAPGVGSTFFFTYPDTNPVKNI